MAGIYTPALVAGVLISDDDPLARDAGLILYKHESSIKSGREVGNVADQGSQGSSR